jgi:Calcineurin-like phosphoesterase
MPSAQPPTDQPLRFAHPFFTDAPPETRVVSARFGRRMLDHIEERLQPVPKPKGDSVMLLSDIIGGTGAANIANAGRIRFHAVGDTGRRADSPEGAVAEAMANDFDVHHPEQSPAFFFHLGDVIYGHQKEQAYRREFYEPYRHYPGKIVAIPGNHDGETIPGTDPTTLRAFQKNFCASKQVVPPIAGTIFRQTMTQPGVFWLLAAPFVDVVGLYSNVAENPGFISGKIPGKHQRAWLVATLKVLAKLRVQKPRKALIIAAHHPPFSSAGHAGSTQMLADIDDACQQAGLMPDMFLGAHSHTYQRYTRRLTFHGKAMEIPFIVAGMGGINDQSVPKSDWTSRRRSFIRSFA